MTDHVTGDDGGENDRGRAPWTPPRLTIRTSFLHSRRVWRIAAASAAALALVVAMSIGGFFLLLSRGPLTFPWLAPRLAQSLDELYSGRYEFALDNAAIANGDHGPTLSVIGLTVKSDGRAIFAAPRAELSVDFRSLLIGRVTLRRLEVLDLDLRLSVAPDGSVAVSAGADPVDATKLRAPKPADAKPADAEPLAMEPGAPIERAALLRQAAAGLRGLMDLATSPDSAIGALDRLGVLHGRLVIDDRTIDRVINYKDVSLSLDKGGGGMRFMVAATGPSRRWTALATARGAPGARRDFDAQLRDLSIDEIALVGGFRTAKFDSDAPLSADLHFALAEDDSVAEAKGRVKVGQGFFRLEDPDHEPVMIEEIVGDATWNKAARKLVIAPLTFKAGGFDMALSGEAAAPAAADAMAPQGGEAWRIALKLDKPTSVTPERAGQKDVAIDGGSLAVRYFHGGHRLAFDKFAFSGPDVNVALNGAIEWEKELRVAYTLSVEDTQIRAMARLWPTHVAAPVRSWFIDHIPGGVLRRATYTGDFDDAALTAMRYERPPPDKSVLAEGDVVDATLSDLLPGMAPLDGVSGHLRVTGRTASFAATSGAMETAPGHRLTISEGRFAVADNALRPTPAALQLHLSGNVEAVADLLALPSVAPYASLPVEPGALKGQVDGKLRVDFEIGAAARADRTIINIDATTSNLTIERLIGKERLEAGALNVVADRVGLRVTGGGRIYGAPATLDVRRAFGDQGAAQAQLTLTFDDAARQRAGYVFPGVSGPVAASIKTPLPVEEVDTQIELDLTRTAFDNPLPGLVKPAGKPARASFTLARRGEIMALEQFVFDAGPMQAQGVVDLARDGAFRAAKFSQARLSPGDDMRVDVQRSGEAVKIVARGANFDARPMLQAWMRNGPERAPPPGGKSGGFEDVDVDFKSPIVTGYGKQILANVDLKMERRGGRPRAFALTGNFGREQLSVAMARNQSGAPQIEISTNDGGSFFAFLDLYRKMDNGALTASVQLGQNRADGVLRIRDFYLRGEPTMRQLMAQGGAARADERGAMRFDPDAVRIGQLQSAFTWANGRLSLREGVMSGPEIGLTFDGFIDFAGEQIDLGGSYVPAYALNSLLSNIPVLGVVIAGGQHEGIFALNYRITGPLAAPVVNVNPLSAIAPGLIRKIMGVLDGTARPPDTGGR